MDILVSMHAEKRGKSDGNSGKQGWSLLHVKTNKVVGIVSIGRLPTPVNDTKYHDENNDNCVN